MHQEQIKKSEDEIPLIKKKRRSAGNNNLRFLEQSLHAAHWETERLSSVRNTKSEFSIKEGRLFPMTTVLRQQHFFLFL
jgi:hypothetical protein